MNDVNNGLIIFEGESIEILFKDDVNVKFDGECLFNGKQVCNLLMYSNDRDAINRHIRENQKLKLSNSNVVNNNFRKLHNTGETFLTEEGVLELITKCKTKSYNYKNKLLTHLMQNNLINKNIYLTERKEIKFFDKLDEALKPLNINGIRQYNVLNEKYRIDYFILELNTAIEYDEFNVHNNYTYEKEEGIQKEIEDKLNTRFIRVSDKNSDEYNIGFIIKELIEGQDKECKNCGYNMNIINGVFSCDNCGYSE